MVVFFGSCKHFKRIYVKFHMSGLTGLKPNIWVIQLSLWFSPLSTSSENFKALSRRKSAVHVSKQPSLNIHYFFLL